MDIPAGLPRVGADPDRLDQVLTNLVGNAIKYSPTGGPVHISAEVWDRRSPDVSPNGRCWLRITVRDQGLGLPAGTQSRIFERFYRIQDKSRYSIRGTGLGLAICKEIIDVHGGSIWAESDGADRGSTFTFTLPVAEGRQA